MKNNVTALAFIIDRSGTMMGFEADIVGGFNAMSGAISRVRCDYVDDMALAKYFKVGKYGK